MTIRRREFLITTGMGAMGTAFCTSSAPPRPVAKSMRFTLTVRGGFVLLMGQQVDLVTIKKPDQPCEWVQHRMLLDTTGLKVTKTGAVRQATLPPSPNYPALTCWDFTDGVVTLAGVAGNTVQGAVEKETACPATDWDNLLHVADLSALSGGKTLDPQWPKKVESRLTIPAATHVIAEPPNEFAQKGYWWFSDDKKWPSSDNNQFNMPLTGDKLMMDVKYADGTSGTLALEASVGQPDVIGARLIAGEVRTVTCFKKQQAIKHFAMYYELLSNPPKCEERLVPVYYPCDDATIPKCDGYKTPGDYCPPGRIKK